MVQRTSDNPTEVLTEPGLRDISVSPDWAAAEVARVTDAINNACLIMGWIYI